MDSNDWSTENPLECIGLTTFSSYGRSRSGTLLVWERSSDTKSWVVKRTTKSSASEAYAFNTHLAYRKALRGLLIWLEDNRLVLSDETLSEYLSSLYDSGLSQATCALAIAAVGAYTKQFGLPSPVGALTQLTLSGIRRSPGQSRFLIRGLLWEEADCVAALQAETNTPSGWRNATIVALASHALLRVSELAALEMADLSFERDWTARLLVQRARTDEEGRDIYFIGERSAGYAARWIEVRGVSDVDDTPPWGINRRCSSSPKPSRWWSADDVVLDFKNFPQPLGHHDNESERFVVSNCLCPRKWGNLRMSWSRRSKSRTTHRIPCE